MDDIICTIPWHCGERDCPVGWHLSNYWTSADGYTVDSYSDGDHEECEESDVPTFEECDAAWRRYARDVVATGVDPLAQYNVDHSRKVQRLWQVRCHASVGRVLLTGARVSGRGPWLMPHEIPAEVQSYFLATETPNPMCRPMDIATLDELRAYAAEDDNVVRIQRTHFALEFKCLVRIEQQAPVGGIPNKLRKAARKHLWQMNKQT